MSKKNITRLQQVQNFAARIICKKRKYEHVSPILKQLKLLPVSETLELRDLIFMHKILNGVAPHYLSSLIRKRSEVSLRTTRSSYQVHVPFARTSSYQNSFFIRASKAWNSLPKEQTEIKSVKVFKNSINRTLLTKWLES